MAGKAPMPNMHVQAWNPEVGMHSASVYFQMFPLLFTLFLDQTLVPKIGFGFGCVRVRRFQIKDAS